MRPYTRDSGGPAPAGNGSQPIYSCTCGAMYTGGKHVCRTTSRQPEPEAEAV
jgi:hypothetical protein